MTQLEKFQQLRELMEKLRDPQHGCAWSRKQTLQSLIPYTIEESYEVMEAILNEDQAALQDELGDLLYQVIFYAQIATENKWFDIDDVIGSCIKKQTERLPDEQRLQQTQDPQSINAAWEKNKLAKKPADQSIIEDIPSTLPAIQFALKLQKRTAQVGFDWDNLQQVFEKFKEEIDELEVELIAPDTDTERNKKIEDEMGDLFFCCINLSRHLKVDPEIALHKSSKKYRHRFQYIERKLMQQNRDWDSLSFDQMLMLWNEAKQQN